MEHINWTQEEVERYSGMPFINFLSSIGCEKVRDEGNRWSSKSPLREDRHPSFYMYKDTLHWEDPPAGEKGGFRSLIRKLFDKTPEQYFKTEMEERRGEYFYSFGKKKQDTKVRVFERVETYSPKDYELLVEGTGIDFNINSYPDALEYSRSRFITDEFIRFFHLGYSEDSRIWLSKKGSPSSPDEIRTRFHKRLCIPIIEDGEIASVEGRDITRHQYLKCCYPASVNKVGGMSYRSLFNIDNLDRNKPLVVCEGVMDIVRIWQSITKNVTCTFGSAIKAKQREVLKGFRDIIIFSDSDSGGLVSIKHMMEFYPYEFRVAQLPSGDPGDKENTIPMLKDAIFNSKIATDWLLEISGNLNN